MENIKDKIIVYLIFARSKLNLQYKTHQKAKKEIDEILNELEKNEDNIEKVEFTKEDLQDEDIVIYRNGEKAVVGRRKKEFKSLENSRVMYFDKYDNELRFRKMCKADKEYDIIKVERPVQYETVFERKECKQGVCL